MQNSYDDECLIILLKNFFMLLTQLFFKKYYNDIFVDDFPFFSYERGNEPKFYKECENLHKSYGNRNNTNREFPRWIYYLRGEEQIIVVKKQNQTT